MKRAIFLLLFAGVAVVLIGCWGSTPAVQNNSTPATFTPSPMPPTDKPDPDPVQVIDKSPTAPRLKLDSEGDPSDK